MINFEECFHKSCSDEVLQTAEILLQKCVQSVPGFESVESLSLLYELFINLAVVTFNYDLWFSGKFSSNFADKRLKTLSCWINKVV